MRIQSYISASLVFFLVLGSCKKESPTNNTGIVGKWNWASLYLGNQDSLTRQNTGIQKTLTFNSDGTVDIIHNDSIDNDAILQVTLIPILLQNEISIKSTFQLTTANAGCVNFQYPLLKISGGYGSYQFQITNDTLQISNGPCLAPFTNIYVRTN